MPPFRFRYRENQHKLLAQLTDNYKRIMNEQKASSNAKTNLKQMQTHTKQTSDEKSSKNKRKNKK